MDFVSDTVRIIHSTYVIHRMMNEIKNCKQKSKSINSCHSRILLKNFLRFYFLWFGGMSLWLSALTAFSKNTLLDDLGSIPSTCMVVYSCVTPLTGDLTKYQCT